MNEQKYWFRAKRYGWGWTPCSWQGWLIIAGWIVANILWFLHVDGQSHSSSDTLIDSAPIFIVSTLLLLAICYRTGETPYWRWGDD